MVIETDDGMLQELLDVLGQHEVFGRHALDGPETDCVNDAPVDRRIDHLAAIDAEPLPPLLQLGEETVGNLLRSASDTDGHLLVRYPIGLHAVPAVADRGADREK